MWILGKHWRYLKRLKHSKCIFQKFKLPVKFVEKNMPLETTKIYNSALTTLDSHWYKLCLFAFLLSKKKKYFQAPFLVLQLVIIIYGEL